MKKFAFVLALSMVFAGAVLAEEQPVLMHAGPGGGTYDSDRAVVWSDPPDPAGNIGSSEIILDFQLESELANDFIIETETTICLWRWWGGYWNGYAGPAVNYVVVRIYDDGGCVPMNTLAEVQLNAGDFTETVFEAEPLFEYEALVDFPVAANLYWFGVQGEHAFPPQWGRLAAQTIQVCDSVFKSAYFAYPDWVPAYTVFGADYDASQEMEDDCEPVATETSSWGAIKSLYR